MWRCACRASIWCDWWSCGGLAGISARTEEHAHPLADLVSRRPLEGAGRVAVTAAAAARAPALRIAVQRDVRLAKRGRHTRRVISCVRVDKALARKLDPLGASAVPSPVAKDGVRLGERVDDDPPRPRRHSRAHVARGLLRPRTHESDDVDESVSRGEGRLSHDRRGEGVRLPSEGWRAAGGGPSFARGRLGQVVRIEGALRQVDTRDRPEIARHVGGLRAGARHEASSCKPRRARGQRTERVAARRWQWH